MKRSTWKSFAVYLVIFLLFFSMIEFFGSSSEPTSEQKEVYGQNYTEFMENVEEGNVKQVTITTYDNYQEISGTTKNGEIFSMPISKNDDNLTQKLVDEGVDVTQAKTPEPSPLLNLLGSILPVLLLVGVFFFLMSSAQGGGGKMSQFGKSKARVTVDSHNRVTFDDVAGADEVKEELAEVVDFLKKPQKFKSIGAKIPKGVLLFGPPGTGKTLLARAVAGEAGVPFFSISGSDFVEMFVGVGASRVRDLFDQAKKNSPCIIFIDEIDAVGRQRGAGVGGGHDEREQTLNQLLVEMDGMTDNTGIVVIAATNRPDVLDPALLRSGRFDRQITVNLPDVKGRKEILGVHARNKKLASDVNLENLAKRTPGFSGADLANVLNEGAILAVRNRKNFITMNDLDEAIDRVMMGPAKKSKKYTEKDKMLVSYHEAGHAVIGLKLPDADAVQKVTIIPRGEAGGYNLMMPREERMFPTKKAFLAQITGLLGGRVAEEIIFGQDAVSAGASNDIEKLTKIAKNMVRVYGMSTLGPIQYADPQGNVFLGRDYTQGGNYSAGVAEEIDKEVRNIVDSCKKQCRQILEDNRELLDLIAKSLYEYETLTSEEILNLMNYGTIENPNVQKVEEVIVEPEQELPPIPAGVDQKDLDDAMNELTKKKDA